MTGLFRWMVRFSASKRYASSPTNDVSPWIISSLSTIKRFASVSQSYTGNPFACKILQMKDFPLPIPPVIPTRNMSESFKALRAASSFKFQVSIYIREKSLLLDDVIHLIRGERYFRYTHWNGSHNEVAFLIPGFDGVVIHNNREI